MTQPDAVSTITKRTQRYWYEDGIWEIGFGLVNILLGGFYLLTARVEWVGPLALVLPLLQIGVILGIFWLIRVLVRLLKERITYPRTGYVAYRKPGGSVRVKRMVIAGLMSAFLGGTIAAISSLRFAENRIPLIIAIVMAGMLIYLGYRFTLARLYLIAALTVALGYLVSTARIGEMLSIAAFFGGLGLLILLSGVITLLIYLRRTRPAGEVDYEAPTGHTDED